MLWLFKPSHLVGFDVSGGPRHSINAIGSILVPLSALLVAPILSRGLGPSDRGEFAADQALILICSAVVGLGVSDAASTAWLKWSPKFRRVLTTVCLGATIVAAVIGTWLAGGALSWNAYVVVGSAVFFFALQARAIGLARQDILGVGLEKIVTSLTRVALTGLFFLLGMLSVETALVALILPQLLGGSVVLGRFARAGTQRLVVEHQESAPAPGIRQIVVATISGLGGVLIVNLDSVYLLNLIGATELGFYAIAVLVAELFTAAAKPFRDAVFDGRSLHGAGMSSLLVRTSLLLASGGLVGLVCIPWGVPFVFGSEFSPAVPACMIMVAGGFAKGLAYVVNGVLVRRGEYSYRTAGAWVGLVASVVAVFPLLPLGAAGASLAKSVGYVVMLTLGFLGYVRGRTEQGGLSFGS